jgi:hypothetical protein
LISPSWNAIQSWLAPIPYNRNKTGLEKIWPTRRRRTFRCPESLSEKESLRGHSNGSTEINLFRKIF